MLLTVSEPRAPTSTTRLTTPTGLRAAPWTSAGLGAQLGLLPVMLSWLWDAQSGSSPRPCPGDGAPRAVGTRVTHVLLTIWSRSPFLKDRSVSVRDS